MLGLHTYPVNVRYTLADGSRGRNRSAVSVPLTFHTTDFTITLTVDLKVNNVNASSYNALLGTEVLHRLGGVHDHRSNPSTFQVTHPETGKTDVLSADNTKHQREVTLAYKSDRYNYLNAPHHVTALKPGADPETDDNFVQSKSAMVNSKRRMFVVLWAHDHRTFFAIPIGSHSHNSLRHIPKDMRIYHICLKDYNDNRFINESPQNWPAEVRIMYNGDMGKSSSVDLLGGYTINMKEGITLVGYLSTSSSELRMPKYGTSFEHDRQAIEQIQFLEIPEHRLVTFRGPVKI
ncbi:hypothetical protein AC578_8727 [Pseudocercospora eumusae]|uniref:Uncharacterized protein n=1 Tax=Pseudocercospora eumusae TaxID=321146 RepID=A0A139HQ74_9PEZI|nr:hypothetical protein AC578_8727 [Pseudocercospora eumusae]